jgi:succinate-semialdehyde dehydrogenase / glutarate-semialdehyde dehydrogenase
VTPLEIADVSLERTGATAATFEEIPDAELAKVIDLAQAGYERDWRNRPIAQRAQLVRAASKLMRARQEHLAAAFGVTARRLR